MRVIPVHTHILICDSIPIESDTGTQHYASSGDSSESPHRHCTRICHNHPCPHFPPTSSNPHPAYSCSNLAHCNISRHDLVAGNTSYRRIGRNHRRQEVGQEMSTRVTQQTNLTDHFSYCYLILRDPNFFFLSIFVGTN